MLNDILHLQSLLLLHRTESKYEIAAFLWFYTRFNSICQYVETIYGIIDDISIYRLTLAQFYIGVKL